MIRWRYHDMGKLGSGQRWASLFYEQLKKSPASPMPPLPLSATDPLLSPLKKLSKPALLLSLSFVPAQKSSIPLHSPQQLLQKSLKKAYVCTAPNALSMRGCWRIFIYYRADITHPFITKRPPRFFFFFLLGEGAWRLGYISSYQIWSSQLFFKLFFNSCLTSWCNRMVMTDFTQSEKTRAAHLPVCRVITVTNINIPLKPYSSRIIGIRLSHPPSYLS